MGKFKQLIEGAYVLPEKKKINQPHSVVTVKLGSDIIACRVWPFTDIVCNQMELDDVPNFSKAEEMDKQAIVILLSDLVLDDLIYLDKYDLNKVYDEIINITNTGGH